jgi:hypothetical protein
MNIIRLDPAGAVYENGVELVPDCTSNTPPPIPTDGIVPKSRMSHGALVAVGVCVGVLVGVPVGVTVGVSVGVFVGVLVGVTVGVFVGVLVGV